MINNKAYIGQTINSLEYRKDQHFRDSVSESRRKTNYFHNAIHKYGKENFAFEEIDKADDEEELNEKERYWIAYYQSNNKDCGYNLDSGGRSGGSKSELTKKRIRLTTLEKWSDPQMAEKMLNGLKRGTETVKKQAKENFVLFTCPVCNKVIKLKPGEANKRKVCSVKCTGKINYEKNVARLEKMSIETQRKKAEIRNEVKQFVIKWVYDNKELILHCPLNKITTQLKPLLSVIEEKYQIKDIRSVMLSFGMTSRKEFISYLQSMINE